MKAGTIILVCAVLLFFGWVFWPVKAKAPNPKPLTAEERYQWDVSASEVGRFQPFNTRDLIGEIDTKTGEIFFVKDGKWAKVPSPLRTYPDPNPISELLFNTNQP